MRNLFLRLWNDQDGILYAEYLILATILVLGLIVGVTAVTAALNAEFTELAQAYLNLNQSYSTTSFSNCSSSHGGSATTDTPGTITLHGSVPTAVNIDTSACVTP
jgi:Flp pilus assembly pilin Flp